MDQGSESSSSTTFPRPGILGTKRTFKDNVVDVPPPFAIANPSAEGPGRYDVSKDSAESKRGLALIFTNDFVGRPESSLEFVWNDGRMLWSLFTKLDFDVIWHANHSAQEMTDAIENDLRITADRPYKMFVCCISTHGEKGLVLGQNSEKLWIKTIVEKFTEAAVLETTQNKPKLFFIDACQGSYLERAKDDKRREKIKFDVTQDFSKIAEHADILLGFAAYQSTVSMGVDEGSYYINALVEYLHKYHSRVHIQRILEDVCLAVQSIKNFNATYCQLPMVLSTLRRELVIADAPN